MLKYDLVVLASGVNWKPIDIRGLDYVPPATQTMSQYELYTGADHVESSIGNTAHVFLIPDSNIIFGTLVPKGPFINVSILTRINSAYPIQDFLKLDLVVEDMYPRIMNIPVTVIPGQLWAFARNFYSDRFVAIGDAASFQTI